MSAHSCISLANCQLFSLSCFKNVLTLTLPIRMKLSYGWLVFVCLLLSSVFCGVIENSRKKRDGFEEVEEDCLLEKEGSANSLLNIDGGFSNGEEGFSVKRKRCPR